MASEIISKVAFYTFYNLCVSLHIQAVVILLPAGTMWWQQLVGHCCHPDSWCRATDDLMGCLSMMNTPEALSFQDPCKRLERRFWAALQQKHGTQQKPSLKARLIKSLITLLCLLTVCSHRGEASLMRLRSVIHDGRLSKNHCPGSTFLNNSQTSEAYMVVAIPIQHRNSRPLKSSMVLLHGILSERNQHQTLPVPPGPNLPEKPRWDTWVKRSLSLAFLAWQGGKGWVEMEGQGEVSRGIVCPGEVT